MTSEGLDRAHEVYEAVLARPPEEREVYLAQACEGDDDLRAEVKELLAHEGRVPEDFMRTPPAPPTMPVAAGAPEPPDPLIGREIGDCRIRRVLASGGMGTVYIAQQEHPRRTVAVKVMRAGIASRSALRRFEFESQILARLRHPAIAQVYGAGTHDDGSGGVPYFVMEYVPNARPITEHVEGKGLGTRERLTLFATICGAVQHAHRKGIIHRDLKPGNILVDSSGLSKIIDFGVARSTDSDMAVTTLQTDIGQLIGTLQYMSPEQCDADPIDLDTRSDVYALGVLLYELLCGRPPYDVARLAVYEAARVIKEDAPERPSTIDRALRGDVETITLKAMEKDRDRRYQSAGELEDDIQRYLRSEPIVARPPSVTYQIRKMVARNPAKFVSVAAGAVTIVVVLVSVMFWLYASRQIYASRLERAEQVAHEKSISTGVFNYLIGPVFERTNAELRYWRVLPRNKSAAHGGRVLVRQSRRVPVQPSQDGIAAEPASEVHELIWLDETGQVRKKWAAPPIDVPVQVGRRLRGPARSNIMEVLIADVLPAEPGSEVIVTTRHHTWWPTVIRILDVEMKQLREVWHPGGLRWMLWDERRQLLICQASSNLLHSYFAPAAGWHETGSGARLVGHDCTVVFALRADALDSLDGPGAIFPLTGGTGLSAVPIEWMRVLVPPPDAASYFEEGWRLVLDGIYPPDDDRADAAFRLAVRCWRTGAAALDADHFTAHFDHEGRRLDDDFVDMYTPERTFAQLGLPELRFAEVDVPVLEQARTLFDERLEAGIHLEHIVSDLAGLDGLEPQVREAAIELAEIRLGDFPRLCSTAWDIVVEPEADPDRRADRLAYAGRLIERTAQLRAGDPWPVAARGILDYRLGRYEEAADTFERLGAGDGDDPVLTAFVAMTHHALGHAEQAESHLDRLVKLLETPPNDTEQNRAIRAEAERLVRP